VRGEHQHGVGAAGVTNTYNFTALTGAKSTAQPPLPDVFVADCVYQRQIVTPTGTARSDEYVSVKGNVVRVFEAVSHKLKWSVTLTQLPTTAYGQLSCPNSGTRVYFSTENAIYAVDRDLKTYWRYAPGKLMSFAGTDGATAYATFAFNDSTALVALNASNGALKWSVPNPNRGSGVSVWLDGAQPYLLNGNTLQQVRKTDGVLGWKYDKFAGSVTAQNIDGAVYAKDLNKFVKLNPADGRVLFTYTTPLASTFVNRITGWQMTTRAAQDDRVLVSTLEPVENLLIAPSGSIQAADKSKTNAYFFEDQAGYAYKHFDYLKPGAVFPVRALMRIDPLTFAAKWSKPYEIPVLGNVFHTTARVIYLTRVEVGPQPMTTVIALHRETGAELWRKSLNASGSRSCASSLGVTQRVPPDAPRQPQAKAECGQS
jgi:outer membrane protein assembly factor BamB